jgi:hypothetical protein
MSGDIGRGATRESIAFAACLAAVKDKPRGLCRFTLLSFFATFYSLFCAVPTSHSIIRVKFAFHHYMI